MNSGYLINAVNSDRGDYLRCAIVLAKSIKIFDKKRPICLVTDQEPEEKYPFDEVIISKNHDIGKWNASGDIASWSSTPWNKTLKIEADVVVTRSLDSWWEYLDCWDVHIATGAFTYRGVPAVSRYYRGVIDRQYLPDVYNGLSYWKKTTMSSEFSHVLRLLYEDDPTIDLDYLYAKTVEVMGVSRCTHPQSPVHWVHMKPHINNTVHENWAQELTWEIDQGDFRIASWSQLYPVHYVEKTLASKFESHYDRILSR